ncbi:MAG TPA: glutathione peroxidase [Chiayiivirga sp.]|nr:glutathione peroxidase [Chiayiivirga sp.]
MTTLHDFTVADIDGKPRSLSEWRDQVVLIVNVASKCGFTPQYEGLEALYRAHHAKGFSVLGFPCDQFGHQEPGDAEEIKNFCALNYEVSFPLFAKIEVNGAKADPLYRWLKSERPGLLGLEAIKWNFTKFLIDRAGRVISRHAPTDAPASLEKNVLALL